MTTAPPRINRRSRWTLAVESAAIAAGAYIGLPPVRSRLCGAVAQLGERLNGIQEVEGSTPFGSTLPFTHLALCRLNHEPHDQRLMCSM